jgi:hypothetical protein
MDKVVAYNKVHKISSIKNALDATTVIKLKQELYPLSFIQSKLDSLLLRSKFYYTLVSKNIKINYIPIPAITLTYMKRYLNRLTVVASIFNITKQIEYWIIPCNITRVFPKDGEYFNQIHINGGYTYMNSGTIYVYRYEDFAKVGLHELLHNSVLQSSDNIPDESISLLTNAFKLDNSIKKTHYGSGSFQRLLPSEAVVEAWAIMMHICFISIEKGIPLQELYIKELNHALSLSHKLLQYQEMHHLIWKEKTHAYAYIRLKTCILYNWNAFYTIKYPYKSIELTNFLLAHNTNDVFIKKVRSAPLPITNTCKMTFYGNI